MRRKFDFEAGRNGWTFEADTFRFTDAADYARGLRGDDAGYRGGGLGIRLGGRDGRDVDGMSGAWTRGFRLDEPEEVTLTFWYKLKTSAGYPRDEVADLRVALDGALFGKGEKAYFARLRSDGDGEATSTGWRKATLDLGLLDAGRHELQLGGFSSGKHAKQQLVTVLFDNVTLKSAPPDLAKFEARVLELTNAFRARHGEPAFANDAKLNAAAEDWSRTMAKDDFFAHSTPDQVEAFGYDWTRWGENIAAGYTTPKAVVRGWIDSPDHRANLLGDFAEIGIGYHRLAEDTGDTNYTHYWTQVFGTEVL